VAQVRILPGVPLFNRATLVALVSAFVGVDVDRERAEGIVERSDVRRPLG